MATIPVFVDETSESRPGTLGGVLSPASRIKEMDTETIRTSLTHLSEQVAGLLQDIKQVGQFKLEKVQLQVSLTAEGGVALIGIAKAGVTGGITLTFSV